mmetsp:Transcript_21212/g.29923  ORF Transcript_21212/g.29923 Transcript_21212/m.29923 type:complete len:257 (-) Transcript_21212:290-1060(-)
MQGHTVTDSFLEHVLSGDADRELNQKLAAKEAERRAAETKKVMRAIERQQKIRAANRNRILQARLQKFKAKREQERMQESSGRTHRQLSGKDEVSEVNAGASGARKPVSVSSSLRSSPNHHSKPPSKASSNQLAQGSLSKDCRVDRRSSRDSRDNRRVSTEGRNKERKASSKPVQRLIKALLYKMVPQQQNNRDGAVRSACRAVREKAVEKIMKDWKRKDRPCSIEEWIHSPRKKQGFDQLLKRYISEHKLLPPPQ